MPRPIRAPRIHEKASLIATGDFEQVWAVAQQFDGWLTRAQAHALYNGAKQVRSGEWIVEIGSHQGRSTSVLLTGARPGARVLAVDPFDDRRWGGGPESLEAFVTNLNKLGVENRVALFKGMSETAAIQWAGYPIGMLFIDGAHDRRSVLGDIDGWHPFLAPHSLVFMHDAFSAKGTTAALLERHLFNRSFSYEGAVGSLVMFEKRPRSLVQATADSFRLTVRLAYFARNLAIKIAIRNRWPRLKGLLGHHEAGFPI